MRWSPPQPIAAPVVTHLHCRVCPPGPASKLQPLLDLGPLDLVAFPTEPHALPHPPVPIDIRRCPRCTLVQLAHAVPPDWRYGEYWYRSGTNEVMVAELTDIVASLRTRGIGGDPREVVLDLGANDGTLLDAWVTTRPPAGHVPYRVAVEPAPNLYEPLAPRADVVYQACFPDGLDLGVLEALHGRCRAITAIAMAYAQDDPVGFFTAICGLLSPDGLAVVQFQDLLTVLTTGQVDYFCHEHLLTFSAYSLASVAHAAGLELVDVEARAINGGSLRCYLRRRSRRPIPEAGSKRVLEQVAREQVLGLTDTTTTARIHAPWEGLARRVRLVHDALSTLLTTTLDEGDDVDLYGASTKGQILAQVCGLRAGLIRQVWERSLPKVGRYYGGTGIPIVGEARGRRRPPKVLIVPIWQFKDAVIEREAEYLKGGGMLVFPLPTPELVWWQEDGVQRREVAA